MYSSISYFGENFSGQIIKKYQHACDSELYESPHSKLLLFHIETFIDVLYSTVLIVYYNTYPIVCTVYSAVQYVPSYIA